MAINYDDYEKQNLDKINAQQDVYKNQRDDAAKQYIDRYNESINAAEKPTEDNIQHQIAQVPGQFSDQYDANAVQKLIGQRQVEEAMANMGLSNSGLDAAAQTGLATQQNAADAATRLKQQAAVDSLNQALIQAQAQAAAQKQAQAADVMNQTAVDTMNNYRTLYQNAVNNALSRYQTDEQSDWQQRQLSQERDIADRQRAENAREADQNIKYKHDALNYQKEIDKKRFA